MMVDVISLLVYLIKVYPDFSFVVFELIISAVSAIVASLIGVIVANWFNNKKSRKRKAIAIKNLIHEVEKNGALFKSLIWELSTEIFHFGIGLNLIPFSDYYGFITLNLEKAISGDYILNKKIMNKLIDHHLYLKKTQNHIENYCNHQNEFYLGKVEEYVNQKYLNEFEGVKIRLEGHLKTELTGFLPFSP